MQQDERQNLLSEKTFREAKIARGNADVFADARECSWADFKALPLPTRTMEGWRFASISQVKFDAFFLPENLPTGTAEKISARANLVSDAAGTLVFADDRLVAARLSPDAAAQGVILSPLKDLPREQLARVKTYFFKSSGGSDSEKISALHRAYSDGAAFLLFVPAGVKIERPFAFYHFSVAEHGATFPYALIVAEENSSVAFSEFFFSEKGLGNAASRDVPAGALTVSRLEIFAKSGANVSRQTAQMLASDAHFYRREWAHVSAAAAVRGIALNLGAARARTTSELCLEGRGANAELFSLTLADGDREIDWRTTQRHAAPDTASTLLCKNVLLDRSRTIFGGSIVVSASAQKTSAAQSNKNLVLSPDAESHSLPGLEIDANDVKCSHGATNGSLDADQLFYLQQRGVPEAAARALLVRGFFEEILSEIKSSQIADVFRSLLDQKQTLRGDVCDEQ